MTLIKAEEDLVNLWTGTLGVAPVPVDTAVGQTPAPVTHGQWGGKEGHLYPKHLYQEWLLMPEFLKVISVWKILINVQLKIHLVIFKTDCSVSKTLIGPLWGYYLTSYLQYICWFFFAYEHPIDKRTLYVLVGCTHVFVCSVDLQL